MKPIKILETGRLLLRVFDPNADADFVLKLVNNPTFIQFIGDKNIRDIDGAKRYIQDQVEKYLSNGFGMWCVELLDSSTPIGMCGLIKRTYLDHPDIGFAFLPEYQSQGYGFEAAGATLSYARHTMNIPLLQAIISPENTASINLIHKLGFSFENTMLNDRNEKVLLFGQQDQIEDLKEINSLTDVFFDLFTNTDGRQPRVEGIRDITIEKCLIINNTPSPPEVCNLDEFMEPRVEKLTNGTLTNFREWEVSHKTEIFETIAQRLSLYQKEGLLNGAIYSGTGMKTFHFIKVNNEWKISAISWKDITED